MSYAPASTKPNVNTPAGRLAAAQEAVKANQTAGDKFNAAGQSPNAGSGFGAGRITFDKQGNTLQDGKIVQFAGRQAREDFLSRQGLGNNGVIVDQAKFANADFSSLANYNIVGNKLEQPYLGENIILTNAFLERSHPGVKPDSQKSNPPQIAQFGNYGQSKLAPDNFYRGSAREDQVKKAEADRATKIYQNTSNKDYLTGGKPQGDKVEFVPPEGFHYFNMGQGILGSEINKGTKEEQNAKINAAKKAEADRASALFYPQQPEYGGGDVFITGGPKNLPTPEKGGVITGKSLGKNYGSAWTNAQLGTVQIYEGNTPAEQAKITAQGKAKSSIPSTPITDENSNISFENGLITLSNKQITEKNNSIELGNGLITLSNKQVAGKNLAQDKAFRDQLHEYENQGGSFEIFLNKNKVKETSGARTYHDILEIQHNAKSTDEVTYSVTYPQKEQALTTAVKNNPEYFLNLPPSYWNTLSKSGFVSEKNIGTITSTLDKQYNADIHSSAIGLIRGAKKAGEGSITIFDSSGMLGIHPYEEPRPKGYLPLNAKTIGESLKQNAGNPNIQYGVTSQENEVASFLKTPFMGKKVSTSTIPSTSFVDVLQFYPALGSGAMLYASRGLEKVLVEKGAPLIRDISTSFKNKANQEVLKRVQPAIPTEPTYDWFPARTRPTVRNTNPMRTPLPKDIFSKDTFTPKPREPGSASPLIPFTPQTVKETPMKTTGIDTLRTISPIPETEKINPPPSAFGKSKTDMFGRPYVSGLPAIRTTSSFSNEAVNVQPFATGNAPIKTDTGKPSLFTSKTTGENNQYLYLGRHPEYLVPGYTTSPVKPSGVKIEYGYNPADLGNMYYSRLASTKGESKPSKVDVESMLGQGFTPKEETTEVGVASLKEKTFEKLGIGENQAIHGTDFISAQKIQEKGPKLKRDYDTTLNWFDRNIRNPPSFFMSQNPELAGFFAFTSKVRGEKPVFVKFDLNMEKISSANVVGPSSPIARRSLIGLKAKGFAGLERFDVGFGKFFENKKEIVIVDKKAIVGKPTIHSAEAVLDVMDINKPVAKGKAPFSSGQFATKPDEVGSLLWYENLETRENVPKYQESTRTSKTQTQRPEIYNQFLEGGVKPINQKDIADIKFEKAEKIRQSKSENVLDILSQTLPTREERLQNYPQLPSKSKDILDTKLVKGWDYSGKVPLDIYKSSLGHSEYPKDVKEFFGQGGEKLPKSSGKYAGKLPVDKFFEPQQGRQEGGIAFLEKETGLVKREYISPPTKTGNFGPMDILTKDSIFPNAKGGKYYGKAEVYQFGNKFPRGSLQNKDVGLVKFEKYQKAHPEPQKIGPEARIESFFKNLPTRSTKAAVSQNELFKSKDIKIGFRRISNKTFEEPKTKGKEVKSSSGQVSIQIAKEEQAKPLSRTRRRAGLLSESQFDYLYEHTPIPKERVTSTSGLKSLSEFGTTTIFANRSATRQNERNFLNIKVTPNSREKLGSKLSSRSNSKLANDLMPKVGNILGNKQSPKSGQKPKQTQKMPSPQLPKQPQSPAFKFKPFETTKPIHRTPPKPPKKPPGIQFWGAGNKQGKKSTRTGPTGLINLGVKGIFSSSFNIKGGKVEL